MPAASERAPYAEPDVALASRARLRRRRGDAGTDDARDTPPRATRDASGGQLVRGRRESAAIEDGLEGVDAEHRRDSAPGRARARAPTVSERRGKASQQAGGDAKAVYTTPAKRVTLPGEDGRRDTAREPRAIRGRGAPAGCGVSAARADLPPSPTMIDETIGSIGSTQGVSDSSRPAMKNAPTTGQNEPPRSTASTPDASAAPAAATDDTPPSRLAPMASTRAEPAPPKPRARPLQRYARG